MFGVICLSLKLNAQIHIFFKYFKVSWMIFAFHRKLTVSLLENSLQSAQLVWNYVISFRRNNKQVWHQRCCFTYFAIFYATCFATSWRDKFHETLPKVTFFERVKNVARQFAEPLFVGMAQWWEHSPPTNVARVRFPDSASYVGWVCWFSTHHREVFSGYSGFPSPQKPTFDLIYFHC